MGWIIGWMVLFSAVTMAEDHTIKLASGLTVEPYIIKEQDAGFEADIVKAAFAIQGYEVEFIYQPLHRTKASFQNKQVDGVLTIQSQYPEVSGAFLSEEYINYRNYAVSLSSKKYAIQTIEDLRPYSIVGFQQAHLALGEAFNKVTLDNPLYSESSDQKAQVNQLFAGRTDIIIIDIRILTYYRNRLTHNPKNQAVSLHNLFESSKYKVAFRLKAHRDVFNKGLKEIEESGLYDHIIDSYLSNPNL